MAVYQGSEEIKQIKQGDSDIIAVYSGSDLVFENTTTEEL